MGMVNSMISQGYEVYAVAPEDPYSEKLAEAGCTFVPIKMDSRGANPIKDFALTLELLKVYRRIKPDLIFHFTIKPNIYGTFAATLLGIPAVNNVCGLGTVFLKDNLVSKIAIGMYKFAFRFPKKIFFQNPDDEELFINKRLANAKKTDVLPGSGINTDYFKPAERSAKEQFTFLMISRIIYDKGITEYVSAVRQLKEEGIMARFQLLGPKDPAHKRGVPLEEINTWIEEGIIEYLGTATDVRPVIHSADCVVLPSYREGTPRTLLEAAAMAKPLVATDVPGCTNVVEDNVNGMLCELKSATDLADKMRKMYTSSVQARQQMGKNGRNKVIREFDEQIVISKYQDCISGQFQLA